MREETAASAGGKCFLGARKGARERQGTTRAARFSQRVEVLELVEVDEDVLLAVTLDVALALPVAVLVAVEVADELGLPVEVVDEVAVAVEVGDDVEVLEEVELPCSAGAARRGGVRRG